jgi:xanthine dehydrogenase accessory factor
MGTSTKHTLALIEELREQGADFCVATVVRTANATSAKAGAKAVVTADGTVHGFVGGGCVTGAVRTAGLEAIASGEPRLIRVKPQEDVVAGVDVDGVELHRSSCPSGGTVDLFLEPMGRGPRLVICGASPVAATLAGLAKAMGWRVIAATLPEDRDAVPAADAWIEGFDLAPAAIGPRDAVVVVTQGRRDSEALKAALDTAAGYVGMVGSRTKIGKLAARIADGVAADRLAALHGPAGLAIGAIDPEEIALSILGEIVQDRRARAKSDSTVAAGGDT